MNNKTTNKATFRKVGKIQNLYRHAKTGTYYSLIKRSGKQFRRSLKTNDLQLAKIRLNELQRDISKLKDKSSHAPVEIVAGNAAAIWNVSPAQTDYTKQDGTLAMPVSSPKPWTVKDCVLAEISFDVQNGADLIVYAPILYD